MPTTSGVEIGSSLGNVPDIKNTGYLLEFKTWPALELSAAYKRSNRVNNRDEQ